MDSRMSVCVMSCSLTTASGVSSSRSTNDTTWTWVSVTRYSFDRPSYSSCVGSITTLATSVGMASRFWSMAS
eukprot:43395-Prymnesium_polylepis.1